MEAILVPGPPKEAFNKNRPMSDLIRAQIQHFKHIEEKLPPEARATLPRHAIVTEDDAARYIAPMTRLLHLRAAASAAKTPIEISRPAPADTGLSLAAVAEAEAAPPKNPLPDAGGKPKPRSRKRTR